MADLETESGSSQNDSQSEMLRECVYATFVGVLIGVFVALSILVGVPISFGFPFGGLVFIAYWFSRFGHATLAQIALNKGDYQRCIEICDEGIKILPSRNQLYRLAASACLRLKDFRKAFEYASRAIRVGGKFTEWSYLLRASANLSLGEFEAAIEDANASARLGLTQPDVHEVKMTALVSLHRYEEALKELELMSNLSKNEQTILLYRASILTNMNQTDKASETCSKLFESITPELIGHGLLVRASLLGRMGKLEEAIIDMNEAIELIPDEQPCYINRGYFLGQKGRLDEAFTDLHLAQHISCLASQGYCESNLARIHLLKGESEKALQLVTQAAELAPTASGILATQGLILLRTGKANEALPVLNKAIELDKYNGEAHWFRSELYEKLGDQEKAKQDKKVATDYGYIPYL